MSGLVALGGVPSKVGRSSSATSGVPRPSSAAAAPAATNAATRATCAGLAAPTAAAAPAVVILDQAGEVVHELVEHLDHNERGLQAQVG